ncbi:MAG: hypothetical protein Q9197_006041 [Variospora fuerteventurae]
MPPTPTGDIGEIVPGDTAGMSPLWVPPQPVPRPGAQGTVPEPPAPAGSSEGLQNLALIEYTAYPMTDIPDALEQLRHRERCRSLRHVLNQVGTAHRSDPALLLLMTTKLHSLRPIDQPSLGHMMKTCEAFQQLTFWTLDCRGVWAWMLNSEWDLLRAVRAYMHQRWQLNGGPGSEIARRDRRLASPGNADDDASEETGDSGEDDDDEAPYVDEDPENIADIPEDIETELYTVPETKEELLAVRHEDIRHLLIDQAATEGEYIYGREKHPQNSDLTVDQTSFLASQRTWGFQERYQYPPIIFVFESKDRSPPTTRIPDMRWRGLLVLDHSGDPVRRFPGIPATLSTHIEGGLMEAIRRHDPRVHNNDLLARMPHSWIETLIDGTEKPHNMTRNVLASRMMRFRENAACLNWTGRNATMKPYDRWLLDNLPEVLRNANSTKGLKRDPTKWESQQMKESARLEHIIVELELKSEFPRRRRRNRDDGGSAPQKSAYHPDQEHDCRDCVPNGQRDLAALSDALMLTVEHFIEVTGKCPRVPLETRRTYRQLLDVVEDQYWEELAADRGRGGQARQRRRRKLKQLGKWTGGIARWRGAVVLNR